MTWEEHILGEERSIDLAVDSAIYDFLAKRKKVYAEIQVTDLCYCVRRAYYEKTLGRQSNNSNWSLYVGILVHDTLLQHLADMLGAEAEVLTVEVFNIYGELVKVYGMCDILHENYIIELKTTKYIPQEPKYSHLMQLEAYLRFFKRDYGYLLYIERDSGKRRIFKHHRDDSLYEDFKHRLKELYTSLRDNKPPKIVDKSYCSFCEYRDICNP